MKAKLIISLLISLSLLSTIYANDPTALRLVVFDTAFKIVREYATPLIAEFIKHIVIPEIHIPHTLYSINITNGYVNFPSFKMDQLQLKFIGPEDLQIQLRDLVGTGQAHIHARAMGIPVSSDATITIRNFTAVAKLKFGEDPAKKTIKLEFHDTFTGLDFVIDLTHIPEVVERVIKNPIRDALNKEARKIVEGKGNEILKDLNQHFPPYIELTPNDMRLNLTLVEPPRSGYILSLSFFGILYREGFPQTKKDPPFPIPTDVPIYTAGAGEIQIYLSSYVFNAALNNLFITNYFKHRFTPDNVPEFFKSKMKTEFFSKFFKGMDTKYGKGINVEAEFNCLSRPITEFTKDYLLLKMPSKLILYIWRHNVRGDLVEVVEWDTVFNFQFSFKMDKDFKISAHIIAFELSDSKFGFCDLPEADPMTAQREFNLITSIITPFINLYLKNITIEIPSWKGISFKDLRIISFNNYLRIDYNLKLDNQTETNLNFIEQ